MESETTTIHLVPADNRRLAILCGHCDEHLRHIENDLNVKIFNRGHLFNIHGESSSTQSASHILFELYQATKTELEFTPGKIHILLKQLKPVSASQREHTAMTHSETLILRTKEGASIKARGLHQQQYVHAMQTSHINFGIGPAGTGKTFLAVACAVDALLKERIQRIILVRPAVEAGERLGFLPGDLAQKVDPYLRPLYDALNQMLGFERVARLVENGVIEIAPLAFMRGRTLNDAFIILDEAQNSTREQMKMFLTRIGFGSTAVITGDVTQIDLPRGVESGLKHAMLVLKDVENIQFTFFEAADVVRHPLVEMIVRAYENFQHKNDNGEN